MNEFDVEEPILNLDLEAPFRRHGEARFPGLEGFEDGLAFDDDVEGPPSCLTKGVLGEVDRDPVRAEG